MVLTHINFIKGLLVKELKDGETLAIGSDIKALKNISFVGGTMPGPDGDRLVVVIRLDLLPGIGQALETQWVSIPATGFGAIALAFQEQAALLQRNTTPTAPLQ